MVTLEGEDLGEHFLTKLGKFLRSEKYVRIVASGRK
jgi:hypothetical protein